MKKEDAQSQLNRAGEEINNLNASAWNTALNPTQYGWAKSLFSIVTIPALSAASVGHLITSAVVNQVDANTFERVTTLGAGGKGPDSSPPATPAPDEPKP